MEQAKELPREQQEIVHRARKRIIESIGQNMDLYGINLSIGHLYGLLFFQNKPMTLDEMTEAMRMSKTSMSTGVRTLVDLKMVNKVWEKGARKDLYEVEMDWFQTFADFFSLKWRKALEINMHAMRKSKAELLELARANPGVEELERLVEADVAKMNEAIRYYMWLDRFIETLETGAIFDLVPRDLPEES
ncbi:GbsR/MarR family transcriptional regulator [Paenibacillus sp. YN15]|uniref:GbsR/MarR family transcriptional regulator n=1 Tax=Paenibacillus sp. YN15 TaxID=1742774 RepID=UPI000DCE7FED|nr:GbsR/MarR family transcriptional regulator [Paenibacillus sp. YN15]RAU93687.1 GbsR/MarR family transcriptional regulator [Paenibacillus sp. YN15]